MVDFRYHLVSLVSVFLALALGIILGAGPLQNSIGNTLQDQVTELRNSRNEARAQAQQVTEQRDAAEAALNVAGNQLISGTLAGRAVAIVAAPGTDAAAIDQAQAAIEAAGGAVTSKLILDSGFTSSDNASYRNALAEQMRPQVEGLDEGADATTVLAASIDTIVRRGLGDAKASELMGYFTSVDDEHTLMTVDREPAAPVDAVLVVLPPTPKFEDSESEEADEQAQAAAQEAQAASAVYTGFFTTLARRGATVALGEAGSGSFLAPMRSLDAGSTVDSPATAVGNYNTAFAVAAEILGKHVELGSGEGAQAPFGTRQDAAKHE